jgi:hypothetical protein
MTVGADRPRSGRRSRALLAHFGQTDDPPRLARDAKVKNWRSR